jgi:hypothetical protein
MEAILIGAADLDQEFADSNSFVSVISDYFSIEYATREILIELANQLIG